MDEKCIAVVGGSNKLIITHTLIQLIREDKLNKDNILDIKSPYENKEYIEDIKINHIKK